MTCKEFKKYLKDWMKKTPKDKRLKDASNIRPDDVKEHIDACDQCFRLLLTALNTAEIKSSLTSNVIPIRNEPWKENNEDYFLKL